MRAFRRGRKTNTKALEAIDEVDRKIISQLQEDSRRSFHKISVNTGISIGTVFNRVKALENRGVLKRYTVMLDSVKIGYDLTAITLVQTEGNHLAEVEKEIAKAPNVIAVYELMGDYDMAIVTRSRSIGELNLFLKDSLANRFVRRTYTSIALNVIKEDPQISLEISKPLIAVSGK